jgi:hypothetical protein
MLLFARTMTIHMLALVIMLSSTTIQIGIIILPVIRQQVSSITTSWKTTSVVICTHKPGQLDAGDVETTPLCQMEPE